MKIRLVSDLHLEFDDPDALFTIPRASDDAETVLVLAGDILVGRYLNNYSSFLIDVSTRFKKVIWVAGNHEYYGGDFDVTDATIMQFIKSHNLPIEFGNNFTVKVDNVAFFCGTLWTDMDRGNPMTMETVKYGMNDFCGAIKVGDRLFCPDDALREHYDTKKYIFRQLARGNFDKSVVVTHHGPSYQSVGSEFVGSDLNAGYVSGLAYDMMDGSSPSLWVHGHVHHSTDYSIGRTRVVTNPRGYGTENPFFQPSKMIEI